MANATVAATITVTIPVSDSIEPLEAVHTVTERFQQLLERAFGDTGVEDIEYEDIGLPSGMVIPI